VRKGGGKEGGGEGRKLVCLEEKTPDGEIPNERKLLVWPKFWDFSYCLIVPNVRGFDPPSFPPPTKFSHYDDRQRADKIVDSVEDGPIAVLLDTSVKGVGVGVGVTFDWEVAKRVQADGLPVIVAGGLELENVRACVKDVMLFGGRR
jgi:hypothetical protein